MAEATLSTDTLRRVADELSDAEGGPDAVDTAAKVVAESLLDRADHHAPVVSPSVVDARAAAASVKLSVAAVPTGRPLEILRSGARNPAERALVSALFAHHLGTVLSRRDGVHALRALLPALDWLEFDGLYPPYTAARATLDDDEVTRLDEILHAAPVDGPTPPVIAAVRALRGVTDPLPSAPTTIDPGLRPLPSPETPTRSPRLSIACEVEAWHLPVYLRVLRVATGWAVLSGVFRWVLRLVFARRSPATLALDGDQLRVVGHSEVLGRTLRAYDVRYPVGNLVEVRRETRYPALPVAVSVFSLSVGAIFGARSVVEGARATYFPLIGLGLGLLAAGIFFDFVVRAVFPGVTGRVRVAIRAMGSRDVVLSELSLHDADVLLNTLESLPSHTPVSDPDHPDPRSDPAPPGSTRPRPSTSRRAPAPRD